AVGPLRRRPQPQLPVQALRHRRRLLGPVAAAPRLAAPDMDLIDGADGAGLHQLDDAAVVVAGVDLRAYLRDALPLAGRLGDDARLVDGVRERLLAVDVQVG